MTVQIEFWQLMTFLIGLAITGITSLVGVARWWAQQSDNRLDERLQTLDNARKSDARRWDERFADLLSQKEFIKITFKLWTRQNDFSYNQILMNFQNMKRD